MQADADEADALASNPSTSRPSPAPQPAAPVLAATAAAADAGLGGSEVPEKAGWAEHLAPSAAHVANGLFVLGRMARMGRMEKTKTPDDADTPGHTRVLVYCAVRVSSNVFARFAPPPPPTLLRLRLTPTLLTLVIN